LVEKKEVGKATAGLVICAILIVILAFFSIWFFTRMQNQRNLNNDLQLEKSHLQNELGTLTAEYQNYASTHTHSNSEYDSYVANHHHTDQEYDQARFLFYYVKPKEQKFGVYDLSDYVTSREWTKPYQEGVFDCSEMSASLEWELENEGWHTIIVLGNSPFDSGRHAWVLVQTSADGYMPVESTNRDVVWWENPNFDNYFVYDRSFETIQEALAYSETEFDWWN